MGSKVSQPMLQHGCCCWHHTPAFSKHVVQFTDVQAVSAATCYRNSDRHHGGHNACRRLLRCFKSSEKEGKRCRA
jgi:hypothetical protein